MSEKTCGKCGQTFPATAEWFNRNSSKKSGLNSWCKKCTLEYQRNYYEANPEKQYARNRRWREANPEYHSLYYAAHPEKMREYRRRWQKAHPEKMREYRRRWYRKQKANRYRQLLGTLKQTEGGDA